MIHFDYTDRKSWARIQKKRLKKLLIPKWVTYKKTFRFLWKQGVLVTAHSKTDNPEISWFTTDTMARLEIYMYYFVSFDWTAAWHFLFFNIFFFFFFKNDLLMCTYKLCSSPTVDDCKPEKAWEKEEERRKDGLKFPSRCEIVRGGCFDIQHESGFQKLWVRKTNPDENSWLTARS